jgi:hypothetical protein
LLPFAIACGEGSLDPDSDLHDVYGTEDDAEKEAADGDDEPSVAPSEKAFTPSGACRVPAEKEPFDGEIPDGDVARPNYVDSSGFFVFEGRLYDKHGNDFVMRGLNNAHAWYDTAGRNFAMAALDDISNYGFNTVRIVWETDAANSDLTVSLLHQIIDCVVQLDMVPMVELHDVTGVPQGFFRHIETGELADWSTITALPGWEEDPRAVLEQFSPLPDDEANEMANDLLLDMAKYYARDDVKEVLRKYEDYLLINIANEWSGQDYYGGYRAAIEHLRDAGLNHTLVLDANGWGQNGNVILEQGERLLEADPQHNLLFSVHMYEAYAERASITAMLEGATELELPIIVGEFGPEHSGQAIDVEFIFQESARLGTGYLSWSWKGNSADLSTLDMSLDWEGESLTAWGTTVVEAPMGVSDTSERASVFLF